ncbi:hypothetical protein LPJ53_005214, partial [Coemansia erecta]
MNRNVLAAARQLGRRPASSTYGLVHLAQREHPGAVQQSIAQGLCQTQRIKAHVRAKVAHRHGLSLGTQSHAQQLQQALSSSDFARLALVLERMLQEHVRVGRPTHVADGQLDECAGRVLVRVLGERKPERERAAVEAAARCLVEIGWRVGRAEGLVWPALGMAVAERAEDSREYGRWLTLLRWPAGDTALARRLLGAPGVGARMLDDLFASALRVGVAADVAAAFYCAALTVHGRVPEQIARELSANHRNIMAESAELRDVGRTLAALAHVHVAQGDHGRLAECLARFAPATASAGWPLGALAQAVGAMHAQGGGAATADACLRVLACVACNERAEFIRVVAELPVFRQRALRIALLGDELEIRRAHKHVPLTRFFVPRLFLHLNDSLVRQMVLRYFSAEGELGVERKFVRRAREAGMLAYRLRSPRPMLWLLQNAGGVDNCQQALRRLDALARTVGEHWMEEHVGEYAAGSRRSSGAYGRCMGRCAGFRDMLLRTYLRLGVEPSAAALEALYESSARNEWRLAAAVLRQIPHAAVPDHLAFFCALLRRLAPWHPAMQLRLYRRLVAHPSLPEHARVSLTVDVLREYLGHGHFYNQGFFRLERSLVGVRACLPGEFGNVLWPRVWALHMFLRRRRLVPRYTLYPWLLGVCKDDGMRRLHATPIPSRERQRELGVQSDLA